MAQQLPVPSFFDPSKADKVWRVPYQARAGEARAWAKMHGVKHRSADRFTIALMVIDNQITFCQPESELFVAGQSGRGAVDDTVRLCEFIYREMSQITEIAPTLDTHEAMQIFHEVFLVNNKGEHPIGNQTMITHDDVMRGVWKVNPAVAVSIAGGNLVALQQHLEHYSAKLSEGGKYALMVWAYHAMLGGIGHALVPSFEEACFFHNIARGSQTKFEIKGGNPLTENYSIFRPEVLDTAGGRPIAQKNTRLLQRLLKYDAVIIGGQAKSHCVAWTIADLLDEIVAVDPTLAKKVYLLEDCTSAVVIPGVIDFTTQANEAFDRFRNAGMHVVRSTDPIESWPGVRL